MKTNEILKRLIKEKGVSNKIACESGISISSYRRYLKGKTIRLVNAIKIIKYFGISLDYLAGLTEKKTKDEIY